MSMLIAMFCDIDDFCKWFEPLYMHRLLQSGQRQRHRQSQLALSEIMTIIVYFHSSHYRDFKHLYFPLNEVPISSGYPLEACKIEILFSISQTLRDLGQRCKFHKSRCGQSEADFRGCLSPEI